MDSFSFVKAASISPFSTWHFSVNSIFRFASISSYCFSRDEHFSRHVVTCVLRLVFFFASFSLSSLSCPSLTSYSCWICTIFISYSFVLFWYVCSRPSFSARSMCICSSKLSCISSFSVENLVSISAFSILHLFESSLFKSSIIRRFSISMADIFCLSLWTSLCDSLYFFCQLSRSILSCPIFVSYSCISFVFDSS